MTRTTAVASLNKYPFSRTVGRHLMGVIACFRLRSLAWEIMRELPTMNASRRFAM